MDTKKRCRWSEGVDEKYITYHDQEWGVPSFDDKTLFEFLILEGAQAGLSWATILQKREGYKENFMDFDVQNVAKFTNATLDKILKDPSVVRNKLKIYSAKKNAIAFIKVQKEFGSFASYLWGFVDNQHIVNTWRTHEEVPASSPLSENISKDLKSRGFTFIGPTIIYAYMQAIGMVNDHQLDCFRYAQLENNE